MVKALPVIDQRSNLMPVPTKKNGMNQPKKMASIFIRGALPSAPWVASRQSYHHSRGKRAQNALEAKSLRKYEKGGKQEQSHTYRKLRVVFIREIVGARLRRSATFQNWPG
jgi:hypothetical protein